MSEGIVTYRSLDFLGFPLYRIGDDGSLWSRNRQGGKCRGGDFTRVPWRRIKPYPEQKIGYLRVNLCHFGTKRRYHIHQLVLLAFVGPPPPGMEARHFPDKNPANNRLDNLRWGTKQENYQDKLCHGTGFGGEQNPRAVLTESAVRQMRAWHADRRMSVAAMAEMFGVSIHTAEAVLYGRTWRHVS